MKLSGYVNHEENGQLIFQVILEDGREFSIDLAGVPQSLSKEERTKWIKTNSVLMIAE
jgi:hypothetical protein